MTLDLIALSERSAERRASSPTQARDLDLLAGVRLGDPDAFRALFRATRPRCTPWPVWCSATHRWPRTSYRRSLLAVWERPDAYEEHRGSVRTWLMTLAHRRAVDRVRRECSQRARSARWSRRWSEVVDDPGPAVSTGSSWRRTEIGYGGRSGSRRRRSWRSSGGCTSTGAPPGRSHGSWHRRSGRSSPGRPLLAIRRLRDALVTGPSSVEGPSTTES